MTSVTQVIPNMLGGVSQQPDPIKLPGQVRDVVNAYLDPTFGCRKRPPTKFIAQLGTDIPAGAKWFTIFRDTQERYIVTCYSSSGEFVVRVWEAETGVERTVTIDAAADTYFSGANLDNISHVSIGDYTLVANGDRVVSMGGGTPVPPETAFVSIDQLGYNTNYSIDLSRDGTSTPTKVYRATGLQVSPGSYEVADAGACSAHSTQNHTVTSGAKTGLSFQLTNQCSAYLKNNAYVSRYSTSILLKNGGVGWRQGDVVTVTQAGTTFTVTVTAEAFDWVYASDGSASYTSPVDTTAGVLNIGTAASSLVSAINAISGYSATSIGNVIRIRRTDTRSFQVATRGGTANNALSITKGVARDISALPSQCWDGEIVKVRNTAESSSDDYYVQFVPDSPGMPGSGSWVETVKPGIPTDFNCETMPFALIRESNGDFTFEPLTYESALSGWAWRECGDEDTNPDPSFVGSTINEMFFYNNRLGFLTGEAVVMSQPGDYFNFFVKSALAPSDADPIDITVAANRPSKLGGAVSTPKGLVLFTDDAQFLLRSEDARFSTQTIEVKQISSYPYTPTTPPQNSGVSIFFCAESDTYTKVLEMAVDSVGERPSVADDTRIIPQYIPKGLTWTTSSASNDLVLLGNNTKDVYVFKFFNQGDERKIAGWVKWTFPAGVVLMHGDVDTFYVVQRNGTSTYLTHLELLDDPSSTGIETSFSNFVPRLDNYTLSTSITPVTSGSNKKLYFPAGSFVTGATPVFISTAGDDLGLVLRPSIASDGGGYYITVSADLVAAAYTIGLEYTMSVKLPSFYTSLQRRPDITFPPVVENVYLHLYYSGRYTAQVSRLGYDTYEMDMSVGAADQYLANDVLAVENATLALPIFCRGDQVSITVLANDPTPSSLSSYTWQGHYNNRGITPLE